MARYQMGAGGCVQGEESVLSHICLGLMEEAIGIGKKVGV